jgi:hypothetical protein
MTLLVATEGDPLAVADRVRTILAAEAPRVEPAITTARRHVDAALSQEWLALAAGCEVLAHDRHRARCSPPAGGLPTVGAAGRA